jgi:hypothetical protein
MQVPVRAICDGRTRKDGTNVIAIQYYHSPEKRTVLPINIYVPGCYWNQKQREISKKLPVSLGIASNLNQRVREMSRRAEDIVLLAKKLNHSNPILVLKQHFYSKLSTQEIEEKIKTRENESNNFKSF